MRKLRHETIKQFAQGSPDPPGGGGLWLKLDSVSIILFTTS